MILYPVSYVGRCDTTVNSRDVVWLPMSGGQTVRPHALVCTRGRGTERHRTTPQHA